jgi:natural product precursor
MKTKKFEKKLSLNKKTIADLDSKEMGAVKGGYKLTIPTCIITCTRLGTICNSNPCC